jgi:uncharacterized membrane protein
MCDNVVYEIILWKKWIRTITVLIGWYIFFCIFVIFAVVPLHYIPFYSYTLLLE